MIGIPIAASGALECGLQQHDAQVVGIRVTAPRAGRLQRLRVHRALDDVLILMHDAVVPMSHALRAPTKNVTSLAHAPGFGNAVLHDLERDPDQFRGMNAVNVRGTQPDGISVGADRKLTI